MNEKEKQKKFWFKSKKRSEFKIEGPLSREKIIKLSKLKKEPKWLQSFRLNSYELFINSTNPNFGPDFSDIDFLTMVYYSKPFVKKTKWEEIPKDIRDTFDKLGVTEEMKHFSATGLQYDSEVIFKKTKKMLDDLGVIFMGIDEAVQKHPDLVREHLGRVVPPNDNMFSALNSAVWSGGTFIYVPKGVTVPFPLHTYFRINMENFGQFERTLIIVEEGGKVSYVEGCTAPSYSKATLHAAVVEVLAKEKSNVKYVTLQNWSKNVYNMGTKRGFARKDSFIQWIDGNFGSKVTMKYPGIYLQGDNSKAEVISIGLVSKNQNIDSGARVIHIGKNTSSRIISKTIAKGRGISTFRGTLRVLESAENAKSKVTCDSLLLGPATSDSLPNFDIRNNSADINHEAKISRLDEEKLFYLLSRGISFSEAQSMMAFGFVRDLVKQIPLEYAIELQRLIELDLEGSG